VNNQNRIAIPGFTHEPSASQNYDWYTPPEIFEKLGVVFDLDPCSPGMDKCFVPTRHAYVLPQNGLTEPWFGLVFCNPPYGRETGMWMQKCKEHGNAISLVFARTGTKWFQATAGSTSAICFIRSRVRFIHGGTMKPASSAGADSMLMAWGQEAKNALINSDLGMIAEIR